jgi:hypothetical protein
MIVNVSLNSKLYNPILYMVLKLEIIIDNLETPTYKANIRRNFRKSRFCFRRLSRHSGVLKRNKTRRNMRKTIRNNNIQPHYYIE